MPIIRATVTVAEAIPKLQVVADYLFNEKTTFEASHPEPHPRLCQ